jgi:UDP:flavonoid glycosyltransferase YjiC (YdhE family)
MDVLFAASNGIGLGHVTRCLAIARRLPPDRRVMFFVLSQALSVVRSQGFYVEYFGDATYALTSNDEWNRALERRFQSVLVEYNPKVVVFDGTAVYPGIRRVIERDPGRVFVWCRRAMWRKGEGRSNLAASSLFRLVLEPGELAADADEGVTREEHDRVARISPIVLLEEQELLSREDAADALSIPADSCNVLVQLGAGNIDDTQSATALCLAEAGRRPGVRAVVAESPIADESVSSGGAQVVCEFPLSRLYRAFDFTVSACGYNTFHEVIRFGVPSIFVPNRNTNRDNQLARARFAERAGIALCWADGSPTTLEGHISTLIDPGQRDLMADRARALGVGDGAQAAAGLVADLVDRA